MRLQACLNGARPAETRRLPMTPEAVAADAIAARRAGAESLHIHPRAPDRTESVAPEVVAATLRAVRAAVPGMAVGISTGDWIADRDRMGDWEARPDFVSVNLAEPDAPEVMALMRRLGVGIEWGLASLADLHRALALPREGVIRALIEMPVGDFPARRAEAEAMRAGIPSGLPILLHGFDDNAWDFVTLAAEWGVATRIGMEDVLTLPDGRLAGNAALVAEGARRMGLAAG